MDTTTAVRAGLLMALLPFVASAPLSAQDVRVTGAEVDVDLRDGGELRGELIEVADGSLLLLSESGYDSVPIDEIAEIEWRRHGFDSNDAMLWLGIGAGITAVGMAVACSRLDEGGCGGQALAFTVLPWGLLGLPFALALGGSAWGDLPADELELRAYARFPQGAPASFRERRDAGRPPGG